MMIITAQRAELSTLAHQAAMAVPKVDSVKEVSGIHLTASAERGTATLTGTNFEVTVRATGGAVVEENGGMVVDAKLFPQILDRLPEKEVRLETQKNGHVLYIQSGFAEYHIGILPGEVYPKLDLPFPGSTVAMTGLPALIRQVSFAASDSKNDKPAMQAVNLTLSSDGLRATACNGYQLIQALGDKTCKGDISLLVPASSLSVLAKLAQDDSVYEVGTTGKSIVFWDGSLMLSARLAPGEALDANVVFGGFQPDYRAVVGAEALRRGVDTALTLAFEVTRMGLVLTERGLTFSCGEAAPDVGSNPAQAQKWSQSAAEVPCLVSSAPDQSFYQDGSRLLAALAHMAGELSVEFSSRGDVVIRDSKARYFQTAMAAPRAIIAAKPEPKKAEKAKKTTKPKSKAA